VAEDHIAVNIGGLRKIGLVELAPLETGRFGVTSARALITDRKFAEQVLDFCEVENVKFLIARCPVSVIVLPQFLERHGFQLMDTLTYYSRDLSKPVLQTVADTAAIKVHPANGKENRVRQIAVETFKNFDSHYSADPLLDKKKCDEVYVDWAYRSCLSRSETSEVFIAEVDGQDGGFMAVRLNDSVEGEAFLMGVAPNFQKRGVYRMMLIHGMNWCLSKGLKRMVESTQLHRLGPQKVWVRLGFEPSISLYTFHKWF